jgi:hypothetical protein
MIDWPLLFRTLPPIVAEVGLWTAEQDSVTVIPATLRSAEAYLKAYSRESLEWPESKS